MRDRVLSACRAFLLVLPLLTIPHRRDVEKKPCSGRRRESWDHWRIGGLCVRRRGCRISKFVCEELEVRGSWSLSLLRRSQSRQLDLMWKTIDSQKLGI